MRNFLRLLAAAWFATASLALLLHSAAIAADRPAKRLPKPRDPIYQEVAKSIRGTDPRSVSARLQLQEVESSNMFDVPPVKESVKTVDGKIAKVVLFNAPRIDLPTYEMAIGFLLVDGRVVDWASNWVYITYLGQDLRLEDVDGDGFIDVAFRAKPGLHGGPGDDRLRRRPGDKREWLAAYRITSTGLKPIFPVRDRMRRLKTVFDDANQSVQFRVAGLPESIAENDMCEFAVSATNVSQKPVDFCGEFLCPEAEGGGTYLSYLPNRSIRPLRPGQTVSQKIALRTCDAKEPATLRWSRQPNESLMLLESLRQPPRRTP
jgi:hypothetical protein